MGEAEKKSLLVYSLIATAAYMLPVLSHHFIFTLPIYFFFLLKIAFEGKMRHTFYFGLLTGTLIAAIHLRFLTNIFAQASIVLWMIIALWTAAFLTLCNLFHKKMKNWQISIAIPLTYLVLEYISCEIYPLKFTWNNLGYMLHSTSLRGILHITGVYGFSALICLAVGLIMASKYKTKLLAGFSAFLLAVSFVPETEIEPIDKGPLITGIQMEFPDEDEVFQELDKALIKYPETDIFMLSEYTFLNGVPKETQEWCLKNKKYLIFGAIIKDNDVKRNTALVINPKGETECTQVKSVPIQFFNDGEPADSWKLWNSPWGKIGLCICYDLSYTKVIDRLVDLGAEALIVPTMDVISWGASQHFLHSRVAPIRAAEYGLPIFKTASSGISQCVDSQGRITASASFPGQKEIISTQLPLHSRGSKPLDRYIFYPALIILAGLIITSLIRKEEAIS